MGLPSARAFSLLYIINSACLAQNWHCSQSEWRAASRNRSCTNGNCAKAAVVLEEACCK